MKIKAVLVLTAFAGCLFMVLASRLATSGSFSIHRCDFYEKYSDWNGSSFDNVRIDSVNNSLILIPSAKKGYIESASVLTDFKFNEILLSWNCDIDISGGLYFTISISPDSLSWYDFTFQRWGRANFNNDSIMEKPAEINGIGKLDTDIIRLSKSMKFYKFSITCFPGTDGRFALKRVSVCYSNTSANLKQHRSFSPATGEVCEVSLAVPFISQHQLPDSIAGKSCSQACVVMVMNYHGNNCLPADVSELAYDRNNKIYGNWPYNTQAAYLLGMDKTWVGRHSSFGELADELEEGKPVVISIAFKNGELSNAPYSRTSGHLIVVRGFDNDNNVLVNDPYAKNVSNGICHYDIDELTKIWTEHGGIAYHLWP